jgi:hypothetical protein
MLVTVHGQIIFAYGDVSMQSKVASVRKSVLAMLYGNYVINGKIDTSKTVKQLGLDDARPFLPIEEHATLDQLLAARSGIYLPSGNQEQDVQSPKRGTEYPGTHYFYNNWILMPPARLSKNSPVKTFTMRSSLIWRGPSVCKTSIARSKRRSRPLRQSIRNTLFISQQGIWRGWDC